MISHKRFHIDFTLISQRVHIDVKTTTQRFHIFTARSAANFFHRIFTAQSFHIAFTMAVFATISHRFHIDFKTITQRSHIFTARSAAIFFHPAPGTTPGTTRNRPGTGRAATTTTTTTPQILSPSPSYRGESPPHAPTQLRLARPHARHARHEPETEIDFPVGVTQELTPQPPMGKWIHI